MLQQRTRGSGSPSMRRRRLRIRNRALLFVVAMVLLIGFLLLRTRIVRGQGLNANPGVGISGTRVQAPELAIPSTKRSPPYPRGARHAMTKDLGFDRFRS
jgi:hypothetical protein